MKKTLLLNRLGLLFFWQLMFRDIKLNLYSYNKDSLLTYNTRVPTHIIHTPVSVGVAVLPQGHLDVLDLLGDSREHSLLQTVKLIKTAPCSHLAQTHEDTTHGLGKKKQVIKKKKKFVN